MADKIVKYHTGNRKGSKASAAIQKAMAGHGGEKKAIDTPGVQQLEPWTDAELDAMTDNLSAEDVKEALASRGPEMRAVLEAKPEDG